MENLSGIYKCYIILSVAKQGRRREIDAGRFVLKIAPLAPEQPTVRFAKHVTLALVPLTCLAFGLAEEGYTTASLYTAVPTLAACVYLLKILRPHLNDP